MRAVLSQVVERDSSSKDDHRRAAGRSIAGRRRSGRSITVVPAVQSGEAGARVRCGVRLPAQQENLSQRGFAIGLSR
jgi:hypothetical protein